MSSLPLCPGLFNPMPSPCVSLLSYQLSTLSPFPHQHVFLLPSSFDIHTDPLRVLVWYGLLFWVLILTYNTVNSFIRLQKTRKYHQHKQAASFYWHSHYKAPSFYLDRQPTSYLTPLCHVGLLRGYSRVPNCHTGTTINFDIFFP